MKFSSVLVAASAVATATAGTVANEARGWTPVSPLKGYPWGNGFCLTDSQANFLAEQFRQVLTLQDRKASVALAGQLVTDNYVESSDSIAILAGTPVRPSACLPFTTDHCYSSVPLPSRASPPSSMG
jgi:hypothetical protein